MRVNFILKKSISMLAAVELNKRMAGTHIPGVVVYTFYHGQELCLDVLFLIDKSTKISLHCTM